MHYFIESGEFMISASFIHVLMVQNPLVGCGYVVHLLYIFLNVFFVSYVVCDMLKLLMLFDINQMLLKFVFEKNQ